MGLNGHALEYQLFSEKLIIQYSLCLKHQQAAQIKNSSENDLPINNKVSQASVYFV